MPKDGAFPGQMRALNREGSSGSGRRDVEVLQWKVTFSPGLDAAGKWADSDDSIPFEQKRHTGACGLVGSRTVEHDIPVAGDLVLAPFDLFGCHPYGAADHIRGGLHGEAVPQVEHRNLAPRIHQIP